MRRSNAKHEEGRGGSPLHLQLWVGSVILAKALQSVVWLGRLPFRGMVCQSPGAQLLKLTRGLAIVPLPPRSHPLSLQPFGIGTLSPTPTFVSALLQRRTRLLGSFVPQPEGPEGRLSIRYLFFSWRGREIHR